VYISTLKLHNFRNLKNQEVSFEPGINLIVGKNGQGKTNLIEAVDFLSNSKSFRTNTVRELINWQEESLSVFATIHQSIGTVELGLSLERGRKKAYLNGEAVNRFQDYLGQLVCVSFSPSDIGLIKDGPQGRRKFIDRHIVDLKPSFIVELLNYNQALKSKNNLLKNGISRPAELDPWDTILSEAGARIRIERRKFLSNLEVIAHKFYQNLSQTDGPLKLASGVEYKSREPEIFDNEKHELFEQLQLTRPQQARQRQTLVGPHRDNIFIYLGEHDSRVFASQGQSRSLVLCLKLAVIELLEEKTTDSPVILLDDVDSELDSGRREAFFSSALQEKNRQIFITTTDARDDYYESLKEHRTLRLEEGKIAV